MHAASFMEVLVKLLIYKPNFDSLPVGYLFNSLEFALARFTGL